MSTDPRRASAFLLAVLLPLLGATPASSAESPGEHIATALRTSPVYVADAYTDAVPKSRQQQLASQITATGLPIKVVLTPLTKGDSFDGDADVLAEVVHDRLALRNVILITTDGEFTDSLNGYEWPADTHQTRDAVAASGFLDETRDAGLAELASKAVELVAEGDGTRAYEEATRNLGAGTGTAAPEADKSQPTKGTWPAWWPVTALLPIGAALLLVRDRRRKRRTAASSPSPFAHPQAVFAAARTADETALRRRAEAEVIALGESIQAAEAPTPQHALDAYDAAAKVLDSARGLPDLAGVLALVAEGRDTLTGADSPMPLCFFNPLHGRAARRTTWRPLGRRDRVQVAACTTCTTALRIRRAPEVLTDTAEEGHPVPYFEVPGERSVWAATGYGSLVREGGESLTERVTRGDFTRTSGRRPDPR